MKRTKTLVAIGLVALSMVVASVVAYASSSYFTTLERSDDVIVVQDRLTGCRFVSKPNPEAAYTYVPGTCRNGKE